MVDRFSRFVRAESGRRSPVRGADLLRGFGPEPGGADAVLFDTLREHLGDGVELVELDGAINDETVAERLAATLDERMRAAGVGPVE